MDRRYVSAMCVYCLCASLSFLKRFLAFLKFRFGVFESKSDGEILRIGDKISDLPDALLLEILSLLPTENAVATSVLSKRYRSLWKMLPNLKFSYFDFTHGEMTDPKIFLDNVCLCLMSHKPHLLQSLHLDVSVDNGKDLEVLVGIAFGLNVRELVLDVHSGQGSFRFPTSLYNYETLETLKLGASILVDVPSPVLMKSLRTLYLSHVEYEDDESVVNLLSGCFCLQDLVVNRNGYDNVKTFTISVPSLQRLTVYDLDHYSHYVIDAPSLKYLKIKGPSILLESCMIKNAPEVVEADIDINDGFYVPVEAEADIDINDDAFYAPEVAEADNEINDAFDENILGALTSVKRLFLNISPLDMMTFPTGSIFYQLAYLELCTCRAYWWNLLTLMLDRSPNLQVLKLNSVYLPQQRMKFVPWGKWNQLENVPECLLLHLETFVWTCYEGKLGDEKVVAKYILRNASHLKKAIFSKLKINSKERVELESVVRASNSCQLVFE